MRRVSEGGSVLGFVIVAVVLAGLLVGGAYFLNRQHNLVPAPVAQQPQQEQKPAETPQSQAPNEQDKEQTPQTTPQAGVVGELPATGPGEVVAPLLMIGVVAGLLTGYLRSRRAYLSL